MTFAWPHVLWLLAVPAAFLIGDFLRRRRAGPAERAKIPRAEAGARSLRLAPERVPGADRPRPRFWLAAGLALSLLALARPQWGRIDQPVYEQSREIILALDLSRSMLSTDVPPSRLARAKLLIESLLDGLRGERVGLVIFSGTAFLQSPLSADYEILRDFLPSLKPGYMPVGGTNYGDLIDTASAAFDPDTTADRYLVILSDGGATDPDWRSHISRLTDRGIRVIGLGVGTDAGSLIPDGSGGFVKDAQGAVVLSKLDSSTLRELARRTGGVYRDASRWVDLPALLQRTVETGRKGRFVEKNQVRYVERFQWALAPALLCLLLSFWLEFPVRPKPRRIRLAGAGEEPQAAAPPPHGPAATVLGAALILAAASALPARAQSQAPNQVPADSKPLAEIVGRLANASQRSAEDWSELAGETIDWGQSTKESGQQVPPGPIRDGLAAVAAGSALNPKAANWPSLRSQLEALLRKPPEQRKPPPKPKPKPKSRTPRSGGQPPPRSQQKQQQQQNPRQSSSQGQSPPQNSSGQPPSQPPSAFGSMDQHTPQTDGLQKVGGTPPPPRQDAQPVDPALEASIQKLDQIRDQDSPAQLFQMLQDQEPHRPAAKPAEDW
jgi:Ca-activated chloride channel homolog